MVYRCQKTFVTTPYFEFSNKQIPPFVTYQHVGFALIVESLA
ncbi:hypothetical protein C4K08_5383 [Pseudomonas chlororaphis subsp. aureofaciens]|nr:hypothetical protein C4K08_5383 [Pseudomonas chlororaphis subsp. aureofaciens]